MAEARLALAALVLEAALGYPDALHRRLPHPVTAAGAAVSALERRWNDPAASPTKRRLRGVAAAALVTGGAALVGVMISRLLEPAHPRGGGDPGFGRMRAVSQGRGVAQTSVPASAGISGGGVGALILTLIATTGLAQRSLHDHVAAVLAALERGDLSAARTALARIVGRDTAHLDAEGIAAAALESLAESFNDGVVAPALWLAAAGLPGLLAYKAANTADSLVGHREPRWRHYGWASARLDDLLNLVPARIAGALVALAGGGGWRVMRRDARRHASPNAGWPEAAMAGALGVRLGGSARYDGVETARPVFGDGPPPGAHDLRRGLAVYHRACLLLAAGIGVLAWRR